MKTAYIYQAVSDGGDKMLALIDIAFADNRGIAGALRGFLSGKPSVTVERGTVLGFDAVFVTLRIKHDIKQRVLRGKFARLSKAVDRTGADCVCLSEAAASCGFSEKLPGPDLTYLYELLACEAAREKLPDGDTAFFTAPRLNDMHRNTVMALCRRYRYVLTDIAAGGDEWLRGLQQRLGVSVVENPAPKQIEKAAAAVFMGKRRCETLLSPNCTVYAANETALEGVSCTKRVTGLSARLRTGYDRALPAGFSAEPLFAYALKKLTLPADALELMSIVVE